MKRYILGSLALSLVGFGCNKVNNQRDQKTPVALSIVNDDQDLRIDDLEKRVKELENRMTEVESALRNLGTGMRNGGDQNVALESILLKNKELGEKIEKLEKNSANKDEVELSFLQLKLQVEALEKSVLMLSDAQNSFAKKEDLAFLKSELEKTLEKLSAADLSHDAALKVLADWKDVSNARLNALDIWRVDVATSLDHLKGFESDIKTCLQLLSGTPGGTMTDSSLEKLCGNFDLRIVELSKKLPDDMVIELERIKKVLLQDAATLEEQKLTLQKMKQTFFLTRWNSVLNVLPCGEKESFAVRLSKSEVFAYQPTISVEATPQAYFNTTLAGGKIYSPVELSQNNKCIFSVPNELYITLTDADEVAVIGSTRVKVQGVCTVDPERQAPSQVVCNTVLGKIFRDAL
jgi:hypothetical protein